MGLSAVWKPLLPRALSEILPVLFCQSKERGQTGFSKEELETCMINQVSAVGLSAPAPPAAAGSRTLALSGRRCLTQLCTHNEIPHIGWTAYTTDVFSHSWEAGVQGQGQFHSLGQALCMASGQCLLTMSSHVQERAGTLGSLP